MVLAYYHTTAMTGYYIENLDDEHVYFRYFAGNTNSRLCKSKIRYGKGERPYFISHGTRLYMDDFIRPILPY